MHLILSQLYLNKTLFKKAVPTCICLREVWVGRSSRHVQLRVGKGDLELQGEAGEKDCRDKLSLPPSPSFPLLSFLPYLSSIKF